MVCTTGAEAPTADVGAVTAGVVTAGVVTVWVVTAGVVMGGAVMAGAVTVGAVGGGVLRVGAATVAVTTGVDTETVDGIGGRPPSASAVPASRPHAASASKPRRYEVWGRSAPGVFFTVALLKSERWFRAVS
jgi:hypothetical protein